jgi:hypothetical protein
VTPRKLGERLAEHFKRDGIKSMEPKGIIVTGEMIDGMKVSVVVFVGVEVLLAFANIFWVMFTKDNLMIALIGPVMLWSYSIIALLMLRSMWNNFATKMQLLN